MRRSREKHVSGSIFDVKYCQIAWCIMPNHVSVLIEALIELGKIIQSWKSFTGRWVMQHNAELELGVPGKSRIEAGSLYP